MWITFHSGNLYFCSASSCLSQLPAVLSQPSQELICHSQVALLLKSVWCSSSTEFLYCAGYTGVTAAWSGARLSALETVPLCVCPGEQRRSGCCINMLRMWGPQIKLIRTNIKEALEAKLACVCMCMILVLVLVSNVSISVKRQKNYASTSVLP